MRSQAFTTTVIGSMPKRPWLFTPATAIDGRRDHFAVAGSWSLTGEKLKLAQDDATRVVIREQERAGVDIVSDGEQRRKNYVTHLTAAMGGFDYENFEVRTIRAGRSTVKVGRCIGPIEHRGPILVELDADWVILSACNTGTGAEAGAEAVSGLGRAFFYAGSRTLLVTNWAVMSDAATALTTDTFRRQAEDSKLARAEALRQAMLGLIDGPGFVYTGKTVYTYAHPLFWAPYSIIGDGGTQ